MDGLCWVWRHRITGNGRVLSWRPQGGRGGVRQRCGGAWRRAAVRGGHVRAVLGAVHQPAAPPGAAPAAAAGAAAAVPRVIAACGVGRGVGGGTARKGLCLAIEQPSDPRLFHKGGAGRRTRITQAAGQGRARWSAASYGFDVVIGAWLGLRCSGGRHIMAVGCGRCVGVTRGTLVRHMHARHGRPGLRVTDGRGWRTLDGEYLTLQSACAPPTRNHLSANGAWWVHARAWSPVRDLVDTCASADRRVRGHRVGAQFVLALHGEQGPLLWF